MELRRVIATRRTESGKGAAKRLRQVERIPAVAYGKELAAEALSVSPKDVVDVLKSALGRNTPIELAVEGGDKRTVLIREYQYHPVTRDLLHTDFVQIHLDRAVQVDVPFELAGKPKGSLKGGILRQVFRTLPVSCLPKHIPVKIVADVTNLDLDEHIAPKDLSLPEGVSIPLPANQTLAAVVTESKAPLGAEEADPAAAAAAAPGAAPAAGGKPAAGAAAAKPAAGDKKPAAKK